jgi:hypothetical protein
MKSTVRVKELGLSFCCLTLHQPEREEKGGKEEDGGREARRMEKREEGR